VAITHYYCRATNGADVAGQGTTHMTAYKTPQFALDDIGATHGRNTVDGDQINICDTAVEGANVLAAPLTLATYGTPIEAAPLILRGYTAVANDGGMAEIDCGGAIMWASAYGYVGSIDIEAHTFGDNNGIVLGSNCTFYQVRAHKGASSPSGKTLITAGLMAMFAGCHVYDAGGGAAIGIKSASSYSRFVGNYVDLGASAGAGSVGISGGGGGVYGQSAEFNIVRCSHSGQAGILVTYNSTVNGNVVVNTAAGTTYGISAYGRNPSTVLNNIVVGFSGVGGVGITTPFFMETVGYNAFYNCTTNHNIAKILIDETAHDVALAADPFVDAAGGNFALTDAAKLALRSAGWPASYLGAATDPHITIGAVQYGDAEAGGGVIRRAMRMIGG